MRLFRRWAHDRGLKPSETRYLGRSRRCGRDLQFSKSGDPAIEEAYRTHFVSPILSEQKRERLTERLGRAPDPDALRLAVAAHLRHRHTDYDGRLMAGEDRREARIAVRERVDAVTEEWRRKSGDGES
jgi:hypothetical protein